MNLGSALTAGFAKDVGITQATVNTGNQLMFAMIVIFEIPSNMVLQRVSVSGVHSTRDSANKLRSDQGYTCHFRCLLSDWWLPCNQLLRIELAFCLSKYFSVLQKVATFLEELTPYQLGTREKSLRRESHCFSSACSLVMH